MTTRKSRKKPASRRRPGGLFVVLVAVAAAVLGFEPIDQALRRNQNTDLRTLLTNAVHRLSRNASAATATSTAGQLPEAGLEIPGPLPKDTPQLTLKRRTYTVSYNTRLNLPNWVAWELNTERLVERESRTDKFLPDPDLPPSQAVVTKDYSNSGWDRGHMCPAADNRWDWRAMRESFYMTNICPQHHNLNRGDWKELEDACREWAQREGRIYIVCGPILYRGKHRTIGREHRITVPDAFFKVVLSTTGTPNAVGFIYKNTAGNRPLDSYVNSVDQVERITGIDFFPSLPDEVERVVEASYDLSDWPMGS